MADNPFNVNHLVACKKCDALANKPDLSQGQKAFCGRCGGSLYSCKKNAINRTLAISLAGLLLIFPAMTLPIIGIELVGRFNEASMVDSIETLVKKDYLIIAICVFLFTIAIPIVRLITAFYISFTIKTNRVNVKHIQFFSSYHMLDHWVMFNVYVLGTVVSMYKIMTMAELHIGLGLTTLILLWFCSALVSFTLDQNSIWERLEVSLEQHHR